MATLAQSHADECSLAENKDRITGSYLTNEIGENIDVAINVSDPDAYIQDAINVWEGEREGYNSVLNVCTKYPDCTLYTQVSSSY